MNGEETHLVNEFHRRRLRRRSTDLHVRVLLMYVQANDLDGNGLELSYSEIGDIVETSTSTARRIVFYAERRFGLLGVEASYNGAGRRLPNRYRIIRDGEFAGAPGIASGNGGGRQ